MESHASLKSEEQDGGGESFPVMVEFKCCNSKTFLFEDGELKGIFHVPMLQDPETGQFRVPVGTTKVRGGHIMNLRETS